jgi:hypothetical protein
MLQLGQITLRGPLAAGGLVTFLAAVLQTPMADDVLVLDVDQVCRGIALSLSGGMPKFQRKS